MVVSPFETQLTREIRDGKKNPSRNMWNRKPFRTKAQKAEARRDATKRSDGAYRCSVGRSMHPVPKRQSN